MSKLPDILFQKTVWDHKKNSTWLGTSLHLYRNFSLYKFPEKMTTTEMAAGQQILLNIFQKIPSFQHFTFMPAQDLSPLDKELLFEHFQCPQSLQEARAGQGFAFDPEGQCLITFHFHNHLQIHRMETSEDLIRAWTSLSKLDEEIGHLQPYAFSPRFGYLTANPLMCGTALEARLLLHVPILRHTGALREILYKLADEQAIFLSLEGVLDDLVGDFLIIKNRYTLGISEEATLSFLQTIALKIALAEKEAQNRLSPKSLTDLKDFVGRSFGLLTHSYQLHSREALDGLSGLKLGADLGWISGITPQKVLSLMLQQRRGHLTHLLKLNFSDPEQLSQKRAEWLHQELKSQSLKLS